MSSNLTSINGESSAKSAQRSIRQIEAEIRLKSAQLKTLTSRRDAALDSITCQGAVVKRIISHARQKRAVERLNPAFKIHAALSRTIALLQHEISNLEMQLVDLRAVEDWQPE